MKTEVREVHRCGFCPKRLLVAKAMIRHEDLCTKNPENKNKCWDCEHLVIEEAIAGYDSFDGYHERKTGRATYFCRAKKAYVFTQIFWKKYHGKDNSPYYDYDISDDGEKMPIESEVCEGFKKGNPTDLFSK